ncbi:MAG: hypothetical protein C0506_13065 [Anaerolinea sp.]|nr:hypothetical protein [Anaerolinea sp.]
MTMVEYDPGYERLTPARVRVLALLARNYSVAQVAEAAGYTYGGTRSCVDDLKEITGCEIAGEIGRWWQDHAASWHQWCGQQAGLLPDDAVTVRIVG